MKETEEASKRRLKWRGRREGPAEENSRLILCCLKRYLCFTFNPSHLILVEEQGWCLFAGRTPFQLCDDGSQGSEFVKESLCAGASAPAPEKPLCQAASIFHSAVVVSRSHLRPLNSQKNKLH